MPGDSGQIVALVDEERHLARVSVAGVRRLVSVALLDGGAAGQARRLGLDSRRLRHLAHRRARGAGHVSVYSRPMGAEYQQEFTRFVRARAT